MAIRIPPKADIELRNAFLDVEERLRALEEKNFQRNPGPPSVEQESGDLDLEVDGDLIVANDLRVEGSIDAPHLYDGLLKVVPSGQAGTSTAQRTINLASSLAIAPGGLSADSVRCRTLFAKRPICHVYRLTVQDIATSTRTDVLWTDERFDNADMHSTTTNTDRITIQESGFYIVGAHVFWESNSTGDRVLDITLNDPADAAAGSILTSSRKDATGDAVGRCSCVVLTALSEDDVLRAAVWQDSGGNLEVNAGSTSPRNNGFWCIKVSD